MAIALEGTPTLAEGDGTSTGIAVPYPSGIVSGEILLAQISFSQEVISTVPPAGWNLAMDHQNATANTMSQAMFWKLATGSETGTVTFDGDPADLQDGRITGRMTRWSGVDTTNPIDVVGAKVGGTGTSIPLTSVTTVTDGAVMIYQITQNSTTATISTLSGTTKYGANTGGTVGRVQHTAYELRATAGATGTRTWTSNTSTQYGGISLALRPSTGPVPNNLALSGSGTLGLSGVASVPGTLVTFVQDVPGTTSQVFKVNVTGASSVRVKVGTNTGLTTGVAYSSYVTPDAQGNAELTVTGLTPGTRYYARVDLHPTTESLDNWSSPAEFVTDVNGQLSFSFAFGSCANGNSASMAAVAAKKPDLLLHLGDEYYADGSGTGLQNFRDKMHAKRTATNQKAAYRVSGLSLNPSDHDGMNNNSNVSTDPTAWANWNTAYREKNPTTGLVVSNGVYRTFKRGRIRFIRLDRKSFASAASATDDSSKTCLGATQKQWFKDTITNSTEPVIVVQQGEPWQHPVEAGDDSWGGYSTERTELANFFIASGKRIVFLAGDMHALAAEDGSSSPGGVAVFQAAPWNNAASNKGGPYDVGPYPSGTTSTVDQYGWMDVVDTGTDISLVFKGFSSDNTQRVTLTKSWTVAESHTGSLNLSASGTLGSSSSVAFPSRALALSGSGTLTRPAANAGLTGALSLSGAGTNVLAGGKQHVDALGLSGSGTLTRSALVNVSGSRALSCTGTLGLSATNDLAGTLALSGAGTLAYTRGAMGAGSILPASGAGTMTRTTGAVNLTQALALSMIGELLRIPEGTVLLASLGLSASGVLSMLSNNTFSGNVSLSCTGTSALSNPTPGIQTTMALFGSGTLAAVGAYMVQTFALALSGSGTQERQQAAMGVIEYLLSRTASGTQTRAGNPGHTGLRAGSATGALTGQALVTLLGAMNLSAEGTQFRSAIGESYGSISFEAAGSLAVVAGDPGLKQTLGRTSEGTLTAVCAGMLHQRTLSLNGSGSLTGVGTVLAQLLLGATGNLTGTASLMSHAGNLYLGTEDSGGLSMIATVLGRLFLQGSGQLEETPGTVGLIGGANLSGSGSQTRTGTPGLSQLLPASAVGVQERDPVLTATSGVLIQSMEGFQSRQTETVHFSRTLLLSGTGGMSGNFLPQQAVGAVELTAMGALALNWIPGKLRAMIMPDRYHAVIRPGRN